MNIRLPLKILIRQWYTTGTKGIIAFTRRRNWFYIESDLWDCKEVSNNDKCACGRGAYISCPWILHVSRLHLFSNMIFTLLLVALGWPGQTDWPCAKLLPLYYVVHFIYLTIFHPCVGVIRSEMSVANFGNVHNFLFTTSLQKPNVEYNTRGQN